MESAIKLKRAVVPAFCISAGVIGIFLIAIGASKLFTTEQSNCNLYLTCDPDPPQVNKHQDKQYEENPIARVLTIGYTPVSSLPVWCITYGSALVIFAAVLFVYRQANYHPYGGFAFAFVCLTAIAVVGIMLLQTLADEPDVRFAKEKRTSRSAAQSCETQSPALYWGAIAALIASAVPIVLVSAVTVYTILYARQ